MIPLPKPRGFWDYGLFALVTTGVLLLSFWSETSERLGWADVALALSAAGLFFLGTILARRSEKASWIARPTLHVYLLAALGAAVLIFETIYADSYLLHRRNITSKQLDHDTVLAIVVIAGLMWSSRKRRSAIPG